VGEESRRTVSCEFPTEEITGAQNYNSAAKFLQNEGCSSQNFVVLEENVPTGLKLDGTSTTPLIIIMMTVKYDHKITSFYKLFYYCGIMRRAKNNLSTLKRQEEQNE